MPKDKYIEVMDTTLRDGEQTQGVSFSPNEKLSIAKRLFGAGVDRIEVANAAVSKGEELAVKKITAWARKNKLLGRVEILGLVDGKRSVDWISSCGGKAVNILAKGSLKHLEVQLRKTPEQHIKDISETVKYARKKGFAVNVYLEDWSNGMLSSKGYVLSLVSALAEMGVDRVVLPDTLGILSPDEVKSFVGELADKYPQVRFDFHAHNDYGLASANTLAAVNAGAKGVHVTVNGLGERAGNAPLDEVTALINDKTNFRTGVSEKSLVGLSRLVEAFSGRRIPPNKPISGESFFTHTGGIHADGERKGQLYTSPLSPRRFMQKREYALGKLSGRASLENNLGQMGIELNAEQKRSLLAKVVALGDQKKTVTKEDLPFLISDVLQAPGEKKVLIKKVVVNSGKGITPSAKLTLLYNGKAADADSEGTGGYDAFMNALRKAAKPFGLKLPKLVDYNVRIPPGGKTDALVETTITWQENGERFKTIGVDSDQVMAAVSATEKMLNILTLRG